MNNPEKEFEKYKFHRLYSIDFNEALHTLKIISRYKKLDVRYALLRDVVVTYCRPFTVSYGNRIKKDRLKIKFEHSNMKDLHDELLTLRDQLFAHTDLTYKNPKVTKWASGIFPMSFKGPGNDYAKLDGSISEIKELIEYAEKKVNDKISEYQLTP